MASAHERSKPRFEQGHAFTLCLLVTTPLALLGTFGCRTTGGAAATSQPALPIDGNAALMEYIGTQPFLTAEAGYRAAHILWTGQVFEGDFNALTAALVAARICGKGWNHSPGDLLDRQTVGYLVCRACGIRGGINWRLTGLGRYAWRELQYRRIAGPGGEWGLVRGGEFQGILKRADEYVHRTGKADTVRAELGTEP